MDFKMQNTKRVIKKAAAESAIFRISDLEARILFRTKKTADGYCINYLLKKIHTTHKFGRNNNNNNSNLRRNN